MKTYAADIKENENVDSLFLVRDKTSSVTKAGNPYLKVRLGDRTGEIEGRIWSSAESFAEFFQRDDFVRIKGKAVFFQDRLQVNISDIGRVEEEGITLTDFFPTTEKDIGQMCASLIQISQEVENPHLRNLLILFWNDQPFLEGFRKAPASKQIHHAYIGGLMEHTLSLAKLVKSNACHYAGLNTDLLMTGAILHDIGKVYELSYRRSFDYSDEGRLLGHILIGIEKLEEKIRLLADFPKDLSVLLKHLLLSHHGQYIYGSPKKPMTLEAVMLHHLDDMDAKVSGLQEFLKTKVPSGARWSAYHPQFEQFFYAPILENQTKPSDNIDETAFEVEK
jgi:3'-5' exoribonuclease